MDPNNEEKIANSSGLVDFGDGYAFQQTRDNTPKTLKLIIKYSGGLIKNETHATYFLIFITILSVLIFFWVWLTGDSEIPLPPPTPSSLIVR